MFGVVKLGADDDVSRAVGVGEPAHCGECVEPHNSKRHGFGDHVGGEGAERKTAADGVDTVLDGAHGALGVAHMLVFGWGVQSYPWDFVSRQASSPYVKHVVIENPLVW